MAGASVVGGRGLLYFAKWTFVFYQVLCIIDTEEHESPDAAILYYFAKWMFVFYQVLCIIDTEEHESPAASYDGGSGVPKRRAEKTFFSACRKKETLLYLYLYLSSALSFDGAVSYDGAHNLFRVFCSFLKIRCACTGRVTNTAPFQRQSAQGGGQYRHGGARGSCCKYKQGCGAKKQVC
jgi:hypothetical protein